MSADKPVSLPTLYAAIHHIHESRFISIVIRRLELSNEYNRYIIRSHFTLITLSKRSNDNGIFTRYNTCLINFFKIHIKRL
jgi:hypothetical protein